MFIVTGKLVLQVLTDLKTAHQKKNKTHLIQAEIMRQRNLINLIILQKRFAWMKIKLQIKEISRGKRGEMDN